MQSVEAIPKKGRPIVAPLQLVEPLQLEPGLWRHLLRPISITRLLLPGLKCLSSPGDESDLSSRFPTVTPKGTQPAPAMVKAKRPRQMGWAQRKEERQTRLLN